MKARCVHRVAWFLQCPWCESERREAEYEARRERERYMTIQERVLALKKRNELWQ